MDEMGDMKGLDAATVLRTVAAFWERLDCLGCKVRVSVVQQSFC